MACCRSYSGNRASAVVVVRVAQRGVGHVRRDGGRAVVRARGQRHPGDEPLAARAGRQDRPRRLVRDLLAARGRPGDAGAGATVNRGCVVQTHLFHDRIMRMDTVILEEGSTLGPHCVALPAARIGAGATVGPASLVMRGDEVPASTRWQGNPIAPWNLFRKKRGDAPDPPRQENRSKRRVTRSKKAAKKAVAPVHRPVPARQRQLRLPGVALRTRPRIQGGDQPARPGRRRSRPSPWRRCARSPSTCRTRCRCRRCR